MWLHQRMHMHHSSGSFFSFGSCASATWLSGSCDGFKWVKSISRIMPYFPTHMVKLKGPKLDLIEPQWPSPSSYIPSICLCLYLSLSPTAFFLIYCIGARQLWEHRKYSHARLAICAAALRWTLAGSRIWEVKHNEPLYRKEMRWCGLFFIPKC